MLLILLFYQIRLLSKYLFKNKKNVLWQRAKKVLSNSLGLEDFSIGLVTFVLSLPDGQVMRIFLRIQITEGLCIQTCSSKSF